MLVQEVEWHVAGRQSDPNISRAMTIFKLIIKSIKYVTGRIDYYENARSRIFTASVTLLGFGVTVLAFGMNYLADAPWLRLSVPFLIAAAIFSMLIHLSQSLRPYHFRDEVPSPWFHTCNMPNFEGLRWFLGTRSYSKEAFRKDVEYNIDKMAEEDLANALKRDIEELVILYAILAYKEKAADTTTKVIEGGLGVFILVMIILFFVNLTIPLP